MTNRQPNRQSVRRPCLRAPRRLRCLDRHSPASLWRIRPHARVPVRAPSCASPSVPAPIVPVHSRCPSLCSARATARHLRITPTDSVHVHRHSQSSIYTWSARVLGGLPTLCAQRPSRLHTIEYRLPRHHPHLFIWHAPPAPECLIEALASCEDWQTSICQSRLSGAVAQRTRGRRVEEEHVVGAAIRHTILGGACRPLTRA